MSSVQIVCSNCGYTREIPASAVPQKSVRATCPRCAHQFVFEPAGESPQEERVTSASQPALPKFLSMFDQMSERQKLKWVGLVVVLIIAASVVLAVFAPPPDTPPNIGQAGQASSNKELDAKFYLFAILTPIIFIAYLGLIVFYKRIPSPAYLYRFMEKFASPFKKVSAKQIQNIFDESKHQQQIPNNAATSVSTSNSDVMNDLIPELKTLNSQEGKFGSFTLLIVTVLLFFGSQIISTKWQDVAILIIVLLIHELGHLVSMKLLRYSDVKMFFIPFLGAAVSGKNRNETAVKSCLVSLMGPFPGIVLGVLLYYLFSLTKNYYIFKTAQVMLLLNAFNFLPLMPLDGGRYIDVLFVNRRYFRFLFAFLGAAVFLLLAVSSKSPVIGLVGVFSVYTALSNLTLYGISNDLKAKGIAVASVGELLENESSLRIAIEKLRAKFPRHFHPKLVPRAIYSHLTVIVNTVKFKPAGFWAKCALLPTYLVILTVSIFVSFTFIAANFKESLRTEEKDGRKNVYLERYAFGKKVSECPVDGALFYHGKGTAFSPDGKVSDIYYYAGGYRTGEWQTFDDSGNVIEKKCYDKGRLVSLSKLENGSWKTSSAENRAFLKKCSEEIQRLSQPYRSNHQYF